MRPGTAPCQALFYDEGNCLYSALPVIPFLRMAFMGDVVTKWRNVLIVPVILAFSVAIISFVALRETPVFLKQRIEHLENSGVASEETKKKGETGGVFHAIRFIAHHRQLRWNALAAFVFAMSIGVTGFYTSIMSTSGMNGDQINQALVAYPILNACMTFLGGFLTDRLGRKRSALTMGMVCFVMLGAFVFAASQGWNAYLVGACYGVFVGAYWSVSDPAVSGYPRRVHPDQSARICPWDSVAGPDRWRYRFYHHHLDLHALCFFFGAGMWCDLHPAGAAVPCHCDDQTGRDQRC